MDNKDNILSEANKFIPTPAEQKLLEVLCNPDYMGVSISDKCTAAGVSRDVYYTAIKKPGFHEFLNKIAMDLVKSSLGDIINTTIKFSKLPKNHQDRKILLEMGGGYIPGIKQDIKIKDETKELNEEEINKLIENKLKVTE